MWEKKSLESKEEVLYKFSDNYYVKKFDIQENGNDILDDIAKREGLPGKVVDASEFVEFLTWVEKVNQGEKKEEWKQLIDEWFNKYSNSAILYAFHKFVRGKEDESSYEKRLAAAKTGIDIKIMWDSISKRVFAYYWNYLKFLKSKSIENTLKKDEEVVRNDIIESLGTSPSGEIVLEKELGIREKEILAKIKEITKLNKPVAELKEDIAEKIRRFSWSNKSTLAMKKAIQTPLLKLKELYKKRKQLISEIKNLIEKRGKYAAKLELAIQINDDLPRQETKTMKAIQRKMDLVENNNRSLQRYIKEIDDYFADNQLSFNFWDE